MDTINKIIGNLTLKTYKKGLLFSEYSENNLIVQRGYNGLLSGLIGIADSYIEKVQMGTNNAQPLSSDVAITNHIDISITSHDISNNILTINFSIGESIGNGITFGEFGLILKSGDLFARKSWTPFLKTSDLSIEGTWKIKI